MTTALNPSHSHTQLVPALRTLPSHTVINTLAEHVLVAVSDDWWTLVGPDDDGDPIDWAVAQLPNAGDGWVVEWETSRDGAVLFSHFMRE